MDAVAETTSLETSEAAAAAPSAVARRIEELGRIILAYSEVTDKLQRSHAQLQQQVQNLRDDLAEKDRQLERKKRLAALGEMAAGMAHEIRNPLGGIQLYASMLAKDVRAQPQSLQLVNKISAGVNRLEALVSQVLQFTREIAAHPTPVDLAEVVDQAVELAGGKMEIFRAACRVSGPRPMHVQVDPLLLGQAVLNLLLNAIEAAGENGRVEVSWSPADESGSDESGPDGSGLDESSIDGRHFRLAVRDNGPGIAPGVIDRIFNPFFTTRESGTGLGLAIVHRIVEAHDGAIAVSNPPGGGALFEIRI